MSEKKRPMIADALRLLRLYFGLSQKQVAANLSLSQSMISDLEKGEKSVTMDVLERYSSAFGIRMSQLMLFAEELSDDPVKTKGKLIVAPKIISLLEKLAPREVVDA